MEKNAFRSFVLIVFILGALLFSFGVFGKAREFRPQIKMVAEHVHTRELYAPIGRHYRQTYHYSVDGTWYEITRELKYYDPNIQAPTGLEVIYYDENDPSRALFADDMPGEHTYLVPLALGGLCTFIPAIIMLFWVHKAELLKPIMTWTLRAVIVAAWLSVGPLLYGIFMGRLNILSSALQGEGWALLALLPGIVCIFCLVRLLRRKWKQHQKETGDNFFLYDSF